MLAACADGSARGSPSAMETDTQIGKKARVEQPDVQVKQEVVQETVPVGVGTGTAAAPAPAEHAARVEIAARIDVTVFHCHICSLPLKPPVFQCEAGHVVCCHCHGELTVDQCITCENPSSRYSPCPAVDAMIRSPRIQCPNDGCARFVTYYEADDHKAACPHAPCACTAPGCGFTGPPPALRGHLTDAHSWPMHKIQYGKALLFRLLTSLSRLLLVAEEDGRVFLVALSALGAGRAARVVCVRANGAAGQQYRCKLWAHAPKDAAAGKEDMVLMDAKVTSSAAPCDAGMEALNYLALAPGMMHGDEEIKEMLLILRIDKAIPPTTR